MLNAKPHAATRIALALALTPLVTLVVCYVIAANVGHVPWCFPFVEGCTSTSSTGRAFPERLVFLPGILAAAILTAMFWRECAACLAAGRRATAIRMLGVVAALSLAIYAVAIGQTGDGLRLVRRGGIVIFMVSSLALQVLFILGMGGKAGRVRHWLAAMSAGPPVAGLMAEILKSRGGPADAINNAVEWNSIVMISAFFAVTGWFYFRRSGGRAASPRE